MYYGLGANLTLAMHFAFIVFVIFGALILFVSKKILFIHIPSVIYGAYIELSHSICPLTYLENWFLKKAGLKSYPSSFIEQYLMPIVYPDNLTAELQFYLGFLLIFTNIVIYVLAIKSFKRS
jgi:disulfide bond formation protein DsbB